MRRALFTLLGMILAAVLLYLAPDAGNMSGRRLWLVALVWAAAGLVAGLLYQAGGRGRPGMRPNVPLLLIVFLPWAVFTGLMVSRVAGSPHYVARLVHDAISDHALARWTVLLPALALMSGWLLALGLLEPVVGEPLGTPPEAPPAPLDRRDQPADELADEPADQPAGDPVEAPIERPGPQVPAGSGAERRH